MKYRDTRIVVFKEDYNPQRREATKDKAAVAGKVLYKKGEKYAIHFEVLKKIQTRGAKIESAEKLDVQKAHDAAKARLKKRRLKEKENA